MKYKKKPVTSEIDAIPVHDALTNAKGNWSKLPDWIVTAFEEGKVIFKANAILIQTPQWNYESDSGMIINNNGNLSIMTMAEFEAEYEVAIMK